MGKVEEKKEDVLCRAAGQEQGGYEGPGGELHDAPDRSGRKTAPSPPRFTCTKSHDHVAKIGSGQTNGKLSQNEHRFLADCYREVDKHTIFGIIETAAEGESAFNKLIRSMAGIAGKMMG